MSQESIKVLAQHMKVMADMAAGQIDAPSTTKDSESGDFQSALHRAILQVNQAQNTAQANVQSFSTGENGMTLEEVMISLQQANISFQTMIAVRNRLVDAYKEVTNLQV
jgi:flagellar hook-basal body complex protein FliE